MKTSQEKMVYECEICDYWEAVHGIKDYHDEKYQRCANCMRRIGLYRDFIEQQDR